VLTLSFSLFLYLSLLRKKSLRRISHHVITSSRPCNYLNFQLLRHELLRCATLMCEPRLQIATSPDALVSPYQPLSGVIGSIWGVIASNRAFRACEGYLSVNPTRSTRLCAPDTLYLSISRVSHDVRHLWLNSPSNTPCGLIRIRISSEHSSHQLKA
jgi:hypothetical protein